MRTAFTEPLRSYPHELLPVLPLLLLLENLPDLLLCVFVCLSHVRLHLVRLDLLSESTGGSASSPG